MMPTITIMQDGTKLYFLEDMIYPRFYRIDGFPTKEEADQKIEEIRRRNTVIVKTPEYAEYSCGCKEVIPGKSKYYDHLCAKCYVFGWGDRSKAKGAWKI